MVIASNGLSKGKLYRIHTKGVFEAPTEVIFVILDFDYEHHKGYTEVLIKAIKPSYFHTSISNTGDILWVRSSQLEGCEELPKNHPAWLLYGSR